MSDIKLFEKFSRTRKSSVTKITHNDVVMYTRVSSKGQHDKNCSLQTQSAAIEDYASRLGLNIINKFGGTFESAKTDGRKEFQRMLNFIKSHKGKVSSIIVFSYSRFSRTGGHGIAIADELREKYGVNVVAITQPSDTTTSNGVFFQNMHLIFSKYDNEQRKQNAIAGMKTKFNNGDWVAKTPVGYDVIKVGGVRKIIVNNDGKLVKKAFEWKAKGMKNEDILLKLKPLGLVLYKQKLTKIFANPFYCGMMCHGLLDGKVVEGNHEKLISTDLFFKVNAICREAPKFGINHSNEQENLPLKKFIFCSDCNLPFTGYIVKKKNIYYYKCRTTGCKCNKNANQLHVTFQDLLNQYQLDEKYLNPFLHQLESLIQDSSKENTEVEHQLKIKLKEVSKKLDNLEEKFYINEDIEQPVFERLSSKLKEEKNNISNEVLAYSDNASSNLSEVIKSAASLVATISKTWGIGKLEVRESLQKLIFPEGIIFDKEIGTFRTPKINSIFSLINDWSMDVEENKKGQIDTKIKLSLCAEK